MFWNSLSTIGISSSVNFWYNSPVKPSGPGLLFDGRFLITVSISLRDREVWYVPVHGVTKCQT